MYIKYCYDAVAVNFYLITTKSRSNPQQQFVVGYITFKEYYFFIMWVFFTCFCLLDNSEC